MKSFNFQRVRLRAFPTAAFVLALLPSMVTARQEQPSMSVRYIGEQYMRVELTDAGQQQLMSRKLVSHQSFMLPLLNAKGAQHKWLNIKVGERNMKLKLACRSKNAAKQLGADVFEINYDRSFSKKPPCFIADDGPSANLPKAN